MRDIQIQVLRPQRVTVPKPNGKKFNKKWGRAGEWVFDKFSEDDWTVTEEISIESVTLTPDKLLEEIQKQRYAIGMLYNKEVECVIVGRDFFNDAMYRAPFTVNFPLELNGDSGLRIFDIPVRFIPWFDGLLIVPKQ